MMTSLAHSASHYRSPVESSSVTPLLDRTLERFRNIFDIPEAFSALAEELDERSASIDEEGWARVVAECRSHPLHGLLIEEDPYLRRAFTKPRGYAGDAVVLDYLYDGIPNEPLSGRGAALFHATTHDTLAAASVRMRRDYLALAIDRSAERRRAQVLALACGHLREADIATAVHRQRVEIVAADQDADSLAAVAARLDRASGVRTMPLSVRQLLRSEVTLPTNGFDLVYAAGLYDYLDTRVATGLTRTLFESVAAGGTLIVPNFAVDHPGHAFMDAFLDWKLICRTQTDMADLACTLPAEQVAGVEIFQLDPCVVYLEVKKA